jgi:CPA2 family monovalent cation:H+ antiporter-2
MGLDYLKPWLDKREGGSEPETGNAVKCAEQHGHAILVGYGELGRLVGEELKANNIPFVIVEDHPDIIEDMRNPEIPAVYGHAAAPGVLEDANIREARFLILTISDVIVAGQLIVEARVANPGITVVGRSSTDVERDYLLEHGANHALVSKRAVAKNLVQLLG